ncbi:MAG: rhodanese-like domain-containing protein [Hyphomicrobiaceae bacterium]
MFGFWKSKPLVTISPEEAHRRAKAGEILLVDVREKGEWAQMRVAGANHAPLSDLGRRLKGLTADKPIVFYCLTDRRSGMAVRMARRLGLPHETHMKGGIAAWRAAGLPVVN